MRCVAVQKERMTNSNNLILSGKYQFLRCLGTGQTSHVYLARHLTLNVNRAIKVLPKTSAHPISVLSEAQLLRSLNHPGIPTIYDIEQDDQNYYLVEEYIPGDSLEAFLLHQTFISQALFLSFCEQLCDIFTYLHSLHPAPILYQDLKPEHIIVCGLQLKLIDFGASWNTTSLGNNFNCFGNEEFSAPESLDGLIPSVASDIYSLGKLFLFLSNYLERPLTRNFKHIIRKATQSNPQLRFETVDALEKAIHSELHKTQQSHLYQTIAIAGSYKGCGSTHMAISLVCVCNYLGIHSVYFERNTQNNIRKMVVQEKHIKEQDGYFMYKGFSGFPVYGPGISISEPNCSLRIYDVGSDFELSDISDCDLILLVCGSALWHRKDAIDKEEFLHAYRERLIFICNPGDPKATHFYAKQFSSPVYPFVYDPDPFQISKEKATFASQLLSKKGRTIIRKPKL